MDPLLDTVLIMNIIEWNKKIRMGGKGIIWKSYQPPRLCLIIGKNCGYHRAKRRKCNILFKFSFNLP